MVEELLPFEEQDKGPLLSEDAIKVAKIIGLLAFMGGLALGQSYLFVRARNIVETLAWAK